MRQVGERTHYTLPPPLEVCSCHGLLGPGTHPCSGPLSPNGLTMDCAKSCTSVVPCGLASVGGVWHDACVDCGLKRVAPVGLDTQQ